MFRDVEILLDVLTKHGILSKDARKMRHHFIGRELTAIHSL